MKAKLSYPVALLLIALANAIAGMTIFSAAFRHTGDKTWKEAVFRTISDIRR